MDKARIAELLRPFLKWDLSTEQLDSISMYIDILLKWNQRVNLTSVRNPDEIVTRHFGESLFVGQNLFPTNARLGTGAPGVPGHVGAGAPTCPAELSSAPQTRASFDSAQGKPGATWDEARKDAPAVVDVGSGAGFPGFPIKIWAPEVRLTLIESNHKKATFLKEIVRGLGLDGAEVFTGRAETFPSASADVVTLRAVERFEDIVSVAAALVRPRGRLALLIGTQQIEKAKSLVRDLEWQIAIPIPLSNSRVLMTGRKQKAPSSLNR